MSGATEALAGLRRARTRARRERSSLGDALYVVYVTALLLLFAASALGSRAAPAPGPLRDAAALAEPAVACALAVAVVLGRCVAAVRGGPVVLPPEEARVLLTWPVPRRLLVLPALLAALSRTLAGAALVTVLLLYLDVHDLGAPATAVLRDDLLLPALVGVVSVLAAWQVQLRPRLAALLRPLAVLAALAAAAVTGLVARDLVRRGTAGGLRHDALLGPDPTRLPFGGAAARSAPYGGVPALLVLLVLVAGLAVLAWTAASRVTAEELLARSRRAEVTRTALKLGFTSSVYLSRSEATRRARRRRYLPPSRSPFTALVAKAAVQEQGSPLLPRLLAAALLVGAAGGAAAHVTPGRAVAPTLAWSVVVGAGLAALGTRFADPLRLDVDRAPLAGSLPQPLLVVGRADLFTSAGVFFLGGLVGVLADLPLGVVRAAQLVGLVTGALAMAVLAAASGALGALSDDPSPLLPAGASIGIRASGLIACVLGCGGAGLLLRRAGAVQVGPPRGGSQLGAALVVLALVAAVAAAVAAARGAAALLRGR